MISDRDVWQAALLLVKRNGADAQLEAAARADQLTEDDDWEGANAWHRIGGRAFLGGAGRARLQHYGAYGSTPS